MKPTKMRNKLIYRATFNTRSKHLTSLLSKDLRQKYGKRSARIMVGDSITVIRGEYRGVTGKVSSISTENNTIAMEGVKKEKVKGDKFDVYIHASNVVITGLNDEDKRRMYKLEGKDVKTIPAEPANEAPASDTAEPETQTTSSDTAEPTTEQEATTSETHSTTEQEATTSETHSTTEQEATTSETHSTTEQEATTSEIDTSAEPETHNKQAETHTDTPEKTDVQAESTGKDSKEEKKEDER